MATYAELYRLATENSAFRDRVQVACVIAAEAVRVEAPATPNHAERLAWARLVFADPAGESRRMLWAVLAQNSAFTVAQITGAPDSGANSLQSAVNNAVNTFALSG